MTPPKKTWDIYYEDGGQAMAPEPVDDFICPDCAERTELGLPHPLVCVICGASNELEDHE